MTGIFYRWAVPDWVRLLGFVGTLATGTLATQAQAPTVTARLPTRNSHTAPPGTNVAVTLSQALLASSSTSLRVYSAQAGGRKAGTYATAGATITFDPTRDFKPGETLWVTVPPGIRTGAGVAAARQVYQFTVAAGGTGQGNLVLDSQPAVAGDRPDAVAVGDVDGDGDLDLLAANYNGGNVSIRLNGGDATGSNTGTFSNGSDVLVANGPLALALGDVDGDGDLDVLAASYNNVVTVRLNGGNNSGSNTGQFSGGSYVPVGDNPVALAVGDVDGDGDLDLVTANVLGPGNTASVRLNGGDNSGSNTGSFSGGSTVIVGNTPIGNTPYGIALGDVDGDGDLDLLTANSFSASVSIRLNGGDATGSNTGTFSNGSDPQVGRLPVAIVLGDVDGDGDLDFAVANADIPGSVTVGLNGGNATGSATGLFSTTTTVSVGWVPQSLALADMDGDGDLDLLAANKAGQTLSVRLNGGNANGGGNGTFGAGTDLALAAPPYGLAVGDLDGDGDLDVLMSNDLVGSAQVGVYRNRPLAVPVPPVAITGDSVLCTGSQVRLTAISIGSISTYAWNTGATTSSILATQAGIYSVRVGYTSGASASAMYRIVARPASPLFSLGADTTLCPGQQVVLRASAPLPPGLNYRWSDGSTGTTLLVKQAGSYTLTLTGCDKRSVTRQVSYSPCPVVVVPVVIPNVITPNGDLANERFVIRNLTTGPWRLAVYNRWGRQVFATVDYHHDWGNDAPAGVYYYLLSQPATTTSYKGWVEVVR